MGVTGGAATSVCVSRATLRASSPCPSGRAGSTICDTGHRFAPSASRRGGSRVATPGATGVASAATLAVPSGSMLTVIANLEAARPGRRTDALHHAAVEDKLCAVAVANGLVADDGDRQCWATIRSGLGAGLQEPKDLDAADRGPQRRRGP